MSQLTLAMRAKVSARHLSFLETGRSRPRQEIILRLSEALDIPLRDRNELLRCAGLPFQYPEARLSDELLIPFRSIIDQMLARHAPYPGFVVDRWWNMVEANSPAQALFLGNRDLSDGPLNMLDWLVEPSVRELIVNWEETLWAGIHRLRREVDEAGGDEKLAALLRRAVGYAKDIAPFSAESMDSPVLCSKLRIPLGGGHSKTISVVSTIARFGSTREVTLDELRIELVFPADEETRIFFESM